MQFHSKPRLGFKNYLAILVLVMIATSCHNRNDRSATKPMVSTITESVYASVKVKPLQSYSPQSVRSGIIKKIYVQEGDDVRVGELVFEITPTIDVNSQLADAKITLEEARSNYQGENSLLRNIKLEIKLAKEQVSLDSVNLERQKRLMSQNIGRKVDFDQVKLKYTNSKNQLALLTQKYAQKETTLKNNYRKALNMTKTGTSQIDDFEIRSKINGKVYSINKEEGDFISPQEKFGEIGSFEDFRVEMDIDEVDITKVELGDSVIVLLDAYDDEVFLAKITRIFPMKNEISQTFRVESEFIEKPPKLYYGLAGEANIVVSTRKNSLVIPTEYLLPSNRVLTDKGEISLKVGMKNLDFVEVLSGIDTTTVLIKPEE